MSLDVFSYDYVFVLELESESPWLFQTVAISTEFDASGIPTCEVLYCNSLYMGNVMRWRYLRFLTFEITLKWQNYIMEIKECSKQFFLEILPKNIFLEILRILRIFQNVWYFEILRFFLKFWDFEILRFFQKFGYFFFFKIFRFWNFTFFSSISQNILKFSLVSMFHNFKIFYINKIQNIGNM